MWSTFTGCDLDKINFPREESKMQKGFMFKGHNKGNAGMDKKNVIDVISRFRSALKASGIKIDRIILYGSWAKNTQSESSDIDLVVISEDFRNKNYWERIDILSAAIYKVFQPIEAVAMTPEEWEKEDSFIVTYARDGEVVY